MRTERLEKDDINKSFERLRWVFNQLKLESPYGKKALSQLKSYKSGQEKELAFYFQNLESIISIFKEKPNLFANFNRLFMELRNISGSVKNLTNTLVLGETELFEIKNYSIILSEILDLAKENKVLPDRLRKLDIKPVIKLLNPDKIITRSFYIHESWSEKLQSIREEKKQIEAKIIAEQDFQKKENLRAKRAEIVCKEKDEELLVRKKLSEQLKKYEESLEFSINNIGDFELILAKAELASSNNCSIPIIYDSDSDKNIIIENAIEPEIAENLKNNYRSFTPVSLELQKGTTLLTGANMGGKSVSLKTIALNTELIRFGFCPFAQKLALKLPDFIEVISGDLEDSNSGLSSFGAEIKALTRVLNKVSAYSGLVIFDELARSTNPYEGSRFVQTLSDRLQTSTSYAIIATHYDGIKTPGANYYQVTGLKNLNNENKLISDSDLYKLMDYHLIKISDASIVPREALNIGVLLGLPKDFIESLKKHYDDSICRH